MAYFYSRDLKLDHKAYAKSLSQFFMIASVSLSVMSGCTFKKNNYEEEQDRRYNEAIEKGAILPQEVKLAFSEGVLPRPFFYEGGIQIPERFARIKIHIQEEESAAGDLGRNSEPVYKSLLKEDVLEMSQVEHGLIRFSAKSGKTYIISIKPIGVLAANEIEFKIRAPKDILVNRRNFEVFEADMPNFKDIGRLFFTPGARIIQKAKVMHISAEKIVVRGKSSGINIVALNSQPGLRESEPLQLHIEAKEVIGDLRIDALGAPGINGRDAERPAPTFPGKDGAPPVYTQEPTSRGICGTPSVEGGVVSCDSGSFKHYCSRSGTNGEDGKDAIPGVDGTDGTNGGVAPEIYIKISKSLARGKISYLSTSGRPGIGGKGISGRFETAGGRYYPLNPSIPAKSCQEAKEGRRGRSLEQQNAEIIKNTPAGKTPVLLNYFGRWGKYGIGLENKLAVISAPDAFLEKIKSEPEQILSIVDESEKYQIPPTEQERAK